MDVQFTTFRAIIGLVIAIILIIKKMQPAYCLILGALIGGLIGGGGRSYSRKPFYISHKVKTIQPNLIYKEESFKPYVMTIFSFILLLLLR